MVKKKIFTSNTGVEILEPQCNDEVYFSTLAYVGSSEPIRSL